MFGEVNLGQVVMGLILLFVAGTIRNAAWGIGGHTPYGTVKKQYMTGLCHPSCKRCMQDLTLRDPAEVEALWPGVLGKR